MLDRFRSAAARFLYGRNGVDQLCWTLLGVSLALNFAAAFARSVGPRLVLEALSMVLGFLALFRVLSRDLGARRAENARLLSWWGAKRAAVSGFRLRHTDRAHKYVRCACGAWCRVPRHVGRVELMCPKCGKTSVTDTNK